MSSWLNNLFKIRHPQPTFSLKRGNFTTCSLTPINPFPNLLLHPIHPFSMIDCFDWFGMGSSVVLPTELVTSATRPTAKDLLPEHGNPFSVPSLPHIEFPPNWFLSPGQGGQLCSTGKVHYLSHLSAGPNRWTWLGPEIRGKGFRIFFLQRVCFCFFRINEPC